MNLPTRPAASRVAEPAIRPEQVHVRENSCHVISRERAMVLESKKNHIGDGLRFPALVKYWF